MNTSIITRGRKNEPLEVIRLAEKANRMVKSGELSKEEAGFYLREAVKELIELSQKLEMKEGN